MKLSSKKIILLFLTFLALGGVSFLLLKQKSNQKMPTKIGDEIVVAKNPEEFLDIDSDEDGLKDWEETLWKLDPKNPDTGGTGVPDEEKVKKKMKEINTNTQKGDLTDDIENSQYATSTETELLSKKLFAEYINLKQSGNLNEESINNTMMDLISGIKNKDSIKYYFAKDLKIFSDSDKISVRKYGNTFASIRDKYDKLYLQNPVVGAEDSSGMLSSEFSRSIARASDLYLKMTQELSGLGVPNGLADTHTEILNNYRASAEGLKGFSMLSEDPIVAMIGIQKHTDATQKENGLLGTIADYFLRNGTIFSEGELGIFWNNI